MKTYTVAGMICYPDTRYQPTNRKPTKWRSEMHSPVFIGVHGARPEETCVVRVEGVGSKIIWAHGPFKAAKRSAELQIVAAFEQLAIQLGYEVNS